MDMKKMTAMGLALMLVAGGASLGFAGSEGHAKSETAVEKKDIKQGEKPSEAEEGKTRGFKKGQKPTETMGTMGKEKTKDGAKP